MTTLNVNALEPEGGTTSMGVGLSGQNTIIGGNTIKLNTLKDAGGNTLFTSDGSGNLSSVNSGFGSAMVMILSQTASADTAISFTANIDSTYGEYIFKFYNIHPATNNTYFTFQTSTDGGSNYNVTLTSTAFWASHNEAGSAAELIYDNTGNYDRAQETTFQPLTHSIQNDADASMSGSLHIFNPSSTTYVKNWYAETNTMGSGYSINTFTAGYFNTTSAVNAVQFKMWSGNTDAGIIKMFGMK